jgi:hypothetical protein
LDFLALDLEFVAPGLDFVAKNLDFLPSPRCRGRARCKS